jgi:hypothetical protein
LLLLAAAQSAVGEPVPATLRVELAGSKISVSLDYHDPRRQEVLKALEEGLTAEIQFQLRLYRRQPGFLRFLGDRMVIERRLIQTARYDSFEGRYRIRRQGRELGAYSEAGQALAAFCSLPDFVLADLAEVEAKQYYVAARVRLTPVKLVAPLNIITLFMPRLAFSSPWLEGRLAP